MQLRVLWSGVGKKINNFWVGKGTDSAPNIECYKNFFFHFFKWVEHDLPGMKPFILGTHRISIRRMSFLVGSTFGRTYSALIDSEGFHLTILNCSAFLNDNITVSQLVVKLFLCCVCVNEESTSLLAELRQNDISLALRSQGWVKAKWSKLWISRIAKKSSKKGNFNKIGVYFFASMPYVLFLFRVSVEIARGTRRDDRGSSRR